MDLFEERLSNKKSIGNGSFGNVFTARMRFHGTKKKRLVALKYSSCNVREYEYHQLREISILKHLAHKNVIKLLEVFSDAPSRHVIVLEGMQSDLRRHIRSHPSPSQAVCLQIFLQIVQGIRHCHARSVIHRDLKPSNILISYNRRVKIADFGQAKVFERGRAMTQQTVTLWYRPPEQLLGDEMYGFAVDIWSLGCILSELLTSEVLFASVSCSQYDQLRLIFQRTGLPTQERMLTLPNYSSFPKFAPVPFEHPLVDCALRVHPSERPVVEALEEAVATQLLASA